MPERLEFILQAVEGHDRFQKLAQRYAALTEQMTWDQQGAEGRRGITRATAFMASSPTNDLSFPVNVGSMNLKTLKPEVVLAGLALNFAVIPRAQADAWTYTGSMKTARRFHTATLLPNGKVRLAGGECGSGVTICAELYDPALGTWAGTTLMTTSRYYHRHNGLNWFIHAKPNSPLA